MKNIALNLLVFIGLCLNTPLFAQDEPTVVDYDEHKVVIQLTTNDTTVHTSLMKNIQNLLNAAPNSKIEVVCHNQGLSFLQTAKTKQAEKIKIYAEKGVAFMACENSMRSQKVTREELVPECGTVLSGVVEIIKKQEQGWSYLRAGL